MSEWTGNLVGSSRECTSKVRMSGEGCRGSRERRRGKMKFCGARIVTASTSKITGQEMEEYQQGTHSNCTQWHSPNKGHTGHCGQAIVGRSANGQQYTRRDSQAGNHRGRG